MATSHHAPPAVVVMAGSVSITITCVRAEWRARCNACSRASIEPAFSAMAPKLAACATKSMSGGVVCGESSHSVLKAAPVGSPGTELEFAL